jgi:hypothetical protein
VLNCLHKRNSKLNADKAKRDIYHDEKKWSVPTHLNILQLLEDGITFTYIIDFDAVKVDTEVPTLH